MLGDRVFIGRAFGITAVFALAADDGAFIEKVARNVGKRAAELRKMNKLVRKRLIGLPVVAAVAVIGEITGFSSEAVQNPP